MSVASGSPIFRVLYATVRPRTAVPLQHPQDLKALKALKARKSVGS